MNFINPSTARVASAKESYLVISEGLTVKGKSLKDHLEALESYLKNRQRKRKSGN